MFTIRLQIEHERFSGLEAVDFFRRLGLPENSLAITESKSSSQYGAQDVSAQVSESFVRAYFHPDQSESIVTIPVRFLVAGDAAMCCDRNNYAVTLALVSQERAIELYLAARFAACRAQVAKLKKKLKAIESNEE